MHVCEAIARLDATLYSVPPEQAAGRRLDDGEVEVQLERRGHSPSK